jgi:hypothetical protein
MGIGGIKKKTMQKKTSKVYATHFLVQNWRILMSVSTDRTDHEYLSLNHKTW